MKKYVIALYIRLSLEDFKTDSLSISSQRMILQEHAAGLEEYGNAELMEFVDNGYSGANFERPAVQELLDLVRANRIDCIMVKDFSRFGRNSLETGYFIERVFPIFHTRFISVSDDFDTKKLKGDTGGMEVAFKYLISEYYSRDMSVKTKTAKYMKMRRGEYQSKICPYGYCKGDNNRMVPDPETSCVIQMIFEYAASGMNSAQIARELHSQAIPTPGEYKALKFCFGRAHFIFIVLFPKKEIVFIYQAAYHIFVQYLNTILVLLDHTAGGIAAILQFFFPFTPLGSILN